MDRPEDHSSDPETLAVLREAFDLAWAKLPPELRTVIVKSALAEVIKHLAKQGETEPLRLSARALKVFHGLT
jgi:hypothetical protein